MGTIKCSVWNDGEIKFGDNCHIVVQSLGIDGMVGVSVRNSAGIEIKSSVIPVQKNGLRIEATVKNIALAKCSNVLTVVGKVKFAEAGNCVFVEGIVGQVSEGTRVFKDPTLTVDWGKNNYKKTFPSPPFPEYKTPSILRIAVDSLASLTVEVNNASCETVVKGTVGHAVSGNCLSVRGRVQSAIAGNNVTTSNKEVPAARMAVTDDSVKARVRKVSATKT